MSYVEISQQEYLRYKQNWEDAIPEKADELLSVKHLKHNGAWVYGYKIAEAIRGNFRTANASNPSFTNVVFRFVIDNSDKVGIVLFGIDKISNDPLTPYYLLNEPITQPPIINITFTGNKQQIAPEIARVWTKAWKDELDKGQDLKATLFHVSTLTQGEASKLQNYTFVLKEVDKLALLTTDTEVSVYFGINKYPSPLDADVAGRNLFNLIVEWNPTDISTANSYYDITQPCPPCCPACP